ncbi:glycoside hydrolase family 15 protein [Paraburkholderia megapolitana]|uniref:Trehalase n=1 Tax=Paraburkholderia megapolitana TaxID=420953 RepID=A0A1I3DWV3_9BURK|nr:glycoside hydrolase family 15 protein [Paraburkholderia megapolitana]QDQ79809.1 glycoside hydrolase family 15 protein [Paraburkholderia megapolitana]SFH91212.1 Glucoamylase (glucan-1,4-alpha-glucosidase), GH15 family [Paraburkholderia megapolitana]
MANLIEDYALVGDGHTAALISRDGSVDWLCWPRFDSGACFAALVGTPEHGRWLLAPAEDANVTATTRRYRGDTLILETDYESADGAVTVIDFMPPDNGWSELVRIVVGRRGAMKMRTELVLRFDYGCSIPWVTQLSREAGMKATAGPDTVVLRTPVLLSGENLRATVAEFTVHADERVPFALAYSASHLRVPPARDPLSLLALTENYWLEWSARCQVQGRYASAVRRSLITLKALTYEPTGGIVAAPTTSLPEHIGGTRNWDYRYCWLRDATITLLALMRGGHYDEARAWRSWLGRVMAGSPEQIQIMYGIAGERRLPEIELDWLPGYEESKPVRVGNGAANQLQLDVFGEVMGALHVARVGGLQADDTVWSVECSLLAHLETIWREPDEGIWETRGGRRHFTFSKVMAWVAFDCALKSAEKFGLPGPLERWRALRDGIHADVCEKGWSPAKQAFTQSYGSDELDASILMLPIVGFLPPSDPRIASTVAAVERELLHDGLVLRYRTTEYDDGLPPGEGTFLACSFWLVDNLALLGRIDDAHRLFRRLLALSNDLGLLAEEYDPVAGRLVGNFPQAFSHVALVHTAMNLMHHEDQMVRAAGHPVQAETAAG